METAITSAAEAESLATLLADKFAAPFLVWERGGGGWHSLGEDTAPATAEQSEWFDVVAAAGGSSPQVRETSDGLHVACPSVNAAGETQVVCGTVELTRKQVAQLAVRGVCEERELSNQILELRELADGYGEKLAESFEELSFFRRLANHVEYCDASRQLTDVAAGVLPSMRQVAGLEGIALVLAANDGSGRIGTVALREAAIHASDIEWIRAIGSVPQRESGVSVVNLRAEHAELADHFDLPGVRSFVLAPIRKDGCLFGWLLGVNKCIRAAHDAPENGGLGHDEIGSTEASLLEAATVLLATHAANVRLVVEKEELVVDAIHTLVGIIEAKDAYTCGHSDRVALLSRRIARELQMDESTCHNIYLTGLLHDVGKVGVSDDVLLKPGQLTDEEFEQIKRHPECGWRLLQRLKPLRNLLDGVRYHHESLDGGGYPEGLAGDEIPLVARIIAVADAWDAMTSDRPYRAGMSWEKAEGILRRGAGQQWDADVVEAFFAAAEDVHDITRTWKDHLRQILDPLEDQSAEGPAAFDASEMLTHAVAADLGL